MKFKVFLVSILMILAAAACCTATACFEHIHQFSEDNYYETPATCTEDGVRYYPCLGGDYVKEEIIPAAHKYSDDAVIVMATCDRAGNITRTCTVCGAEGFETLEPTGHAFIEGDIYENPTCTKSGVRIMQCKNDYRHSYLVPVAPLGHTYGKWVTTVEPGCSYPGKEESRCSVCGDTAERALVAVEHSYRDGKCSTCGRRDWTTADITDPDLYNSEYSFRAFASEVHGAEKQLLYARIDEAARAYHDGTEDLEDAEGIIFQCNYERENLTLDEAISVWKGYRDDHPLYYWISNAAKYDERVKNFAVVADLAYIDYEERAAYNQLIYTTVDSWRKDTPDNAYLAALSYHDKIVYSVDYAYHEDGRTAQSASWAHNILGVFTKQGAVCEGYSRTFQMMLNATGVENRFVTGVAGNVAHAWNLVKLDDGKWYWFDLTFDDAPEWATGAKYNYFAVSETENVNRSDGSWVAQEAVFTDNHTIDSGVGVEYLAPLPERSTIAYNGMGETRLRSTFTLGKFTYALVGYKAVQLIGCTASGDVSIPESVTYGGEDYEVISVGAMDDNGLFSSSNIYCVFTLGAIKTLTIPKTVRFLWESARPAGANALSVNYYNDHSSVVAYAVDEDNDYYEAVDGVLFTKGMYTLIAYPSGSERTEYSIPDCVAYLAQSAFEIGCRLQTLIIGEGLKSAGNVNRGYGWLSDETHGNDSFVKDWSNIFYYLEELEEIKISEGNTSFSTQNGLLFNLDKTTLIAGLPDLTEIIVPASVTAVGGRAFYSCKAERIVFEGDALKSIGLNAFNRCDKVTEVVFGGTEAQWAEVEKDANWDSAFSSNDYALTCLGVEQEPDDNADQA